VTGFRDKHETHAHEFAKKLTTKIEKITVARTEIEAFSIDIYRTRELERALENIEETILNEAGKSREEQAKSICFPTMACVVSFDIDAYGCSIHMMPQPEAYRKPSAEEYALRELTSRTEEMERAAEEEASKKIAEENELLNECVVCIDGPSTEVVVPCGHKCLCKACAERFQVGDPCPVCRSEVLMTMTVFGR